MFRVLASLCLATLLTACASSGGGGGYGYRDDYRYNRCEQCGVVERVEVARYGDGRTSGGGAVAGAIIGGVLGSQVGSGRGRDAATIAGAVAGGVAGNRIESERRSKDVYAVYVRMDDGRRRVFEQRELDGLYEGARVEIRNGRAVQI
ncbi:glycine zipper 2TM domain-containing protein [Pseudomarimonas salicorniae]|uniref:Glycine zipper 2TM domain-containing protein n=1 Tax=Pseudomarimonas salicorniae TaxID=2933270 RepID=A0ABT0GEK0_9GAMM|nr:glycine zipper 2TM domain-containing protein [Lysobacter sp. CAU 1642]MCK7592440.1 glycine zipper 2TM domain-containing protein [Lysobacter sp. CAU 1642]